MPVKNTFKFFVSKAKPVLKNTGKEIFYSTLGASVGGTLVQTSHGIKKSKLQKQKEKCLQKNKINLSDPKGKRMKKLRKFGKCMNYKNIK